MFAAADEATKPFAQPDVRLPPEVLDRFRERVDAGLDVLGDFGGMTIGPGAFDQGAPRVSMACGRVPSGRVPSLWRARALRSSASERGAVARRMPVPTMWARAATPER